jgi:hypothetical protein
MGCSPHWQTDASCVVSNQKFEPPLCAAGADNATGPAYHRLIDQCFMPWQIQYVPEKETLVVTTTGPVSDDEARELTGRAITLLRETQATRVLGDCRAMESAPSLGVVYWLINDYANRGVPRQTKIAVVHSRAPHVAEFARFYETVCFNRHYEARAFDSSEAAEVWLHSDAAA